MIRPCRFSECMNFGVLSCEIKEEKFRRIYSIAIPRMFTFTRPREHLSAEFSWQDMYVPDLQCCWHCYSEADWLTGAAKQNVTFTRSSFDGSVYAVG